MNPSSGEFAFAPAAPGPSVGGGPRRAGAFAQSAFVLHSHDWSESSLIVELFSRDAGRVVAAAKGAKKRPARARRKTRRVTSRRKR